MTRTAVGTRIPVHFDRVGLAAAGFVGFAAVRDLRRSLGQVPVVGGVYAAVRTSDGQPSFRVVGSGGHFKGKDPNGPLATLRAIWVDGGHVVYLGKAESLDERIGSLLAFGAGRAVGHWGGRYLWQLADAEELLIAWREEADPIVAEHELLAAFVACHGALPFANLRW